MKEALVVFVIALFLGSFINSLGLMDSNPGAAKVANQVTGGAATESTLPQVTDSNFKQEVLDSELPVLVDFWAPWCMPCLMEAPIVEQIALKHVGRLKVVKVNVDKSVDVPAKYQIESQGIPNLCLFKNGKLVDRLIGAAPMDALDQFVQNNLRQP